MVKRLRAAVKIARQNETWRGEYMTYRDIERRGYIQGELKGEAKGRAEGEAKGKAEERQLLISGIENLIKSGKLPDDSVEMLLQAVGQRNVPTE